MKMSFAVCAEFACMIFVVSTGMIPVLSPGHDIKTKCKCQDIMGLVDFRPPCVTQPNTSEGTIRG